MTEALQSLMGGAIIGLASAGVLYTQGKVAGVSGILGGVLHPTRGDAAWRLAFVVGMFGSGALLGMVRPQWFSLAGAPSLGWLAAAGLVVGVGTRLGNGCTSGHGVCGIGRFSRRSIAATLTFMLTAGATVFVTHHLVGGFD